MTKRVYYFRPSPLEKLLRKLSAGYQSVAIDRDAPPSRWRLPAVFVVDAARDRPKDLEQTVPFGKTLRVIYLIQRSRPPRGLSKRSSFALLSKPASMPILEKALSAAFEALSEVRKRSRTRKELVQTRSELGTLNRIGLALSTEHNTDALLELILNQSREITNSDAGSLYLMGGDEGEGARHLLFKLTQNDSISVPFREFTMPLDTRSLAGYAASTGKIVNISDAYRIRRRPFAFNRKFDEKFGYRTKSVLVVPMKNQKDEVIGVIQLINAKRRRRARLTSPEKVREEVISFSKRSQELAGALAGQAAVSLENNLLYRNIQGLFEGFIRASVKAIEFRDPTTFGHSERVAKLTVGLAEAVDQSEMGPYRDLRFNRQDIQEIRYAALLHDFGKVGVREEVLIKAKKLYPAQMELIHKRFQYIRKSIQSENYRRKLEHVLQNGRENHHVYFREVDQECDAQLREMEQFLGDILQANEPTVLPEKISDQLSEILGWVFQDPSGPPEALLTEDEYRLLTIPKGSLNELERREIESHVEHSYRILSQIPWTRELRRVPEIARAHHEKLDGSGYPYRMKSEQIPFQSKIMTICDIFDALTARDRPYKKAVPTDRALDIIGTEVKSRLLDPALFQVFLGAKIFKMTERE